ncbi:mucin-3B-like [Alosa sapidissima]|uniref:mucin-3B-like n=1 Tax=Alosa sapidissima TaxID=34773 RepID=UPI001C09BD45|nr:mucin-3B-like [Alosa sapidissima]
MVDTTTVSSSSAQPESTASSEGTTIVDTTTVSSSSAQPESTASSERTTTVDTTTVSSSSPQTELTTTAVPSSSAQTEPTTTDDPSTITTVTTVSPIKCENGGTPKKEGSCCLCPALFSGCTCAVIDSIISPDKLERTVNTAIEVKKPFLQEYKNKFSEEYQEFSTNFTKEMDHIYSAKVKNFKTVVNITLKEATGSRGMFFAVLPTDRQSSVNAEHDIVVEVPNTKEAEEVFNKTFEEVKVALETVGSCSSSAPDTGSCPSFGVGKVQKAVKVPFDKAVVCSKVDADFVDYFGPKELDGVLKCVSQCDDAHDHTKHCYNHGICEMLRQGPTCYCKHSDQNWFLGSDCRNPVHKTGLYTGLGVSAALLVVTIAALSAYIVLKQKRVKDVKKQLVTEWMDEDIQWPSSASRAYTRSTGMNDNPAFHHGHMQQHSRGNQPGFHNGFPPAPGHNSPIGGPGWSGGGLQEGPSFRNPLLDYPAYPSAASARPPQYAHPAYADPQIQLYNLPMWRQAHLRSSVSSYDI